MMRHAYAVSCITGKDYDRDIEASEKIRVGQLSPQILDHLNKIQLVLCSSAPRARQTLDILSDRLKSLKSIEYLDDLYYKRTRYTDIIWDLVTQTPDSISTILILGHNPGLTSFYNDLHVANYESIHFPTLGLVKILFHGDHWAKVGPHLVQEKLILT